VENIKKKISHTKFEKKKKRETEKLKKITPTKSMMNMCT